MGEPGREKERIGRNNNVIIKRITLLKTFKFCTDTSFESIFVIYPLIDTIVFSHVIAGV